MRFLLVNPFCPLSEMPSPPLGLACLAAVLEKAGVEVKILDLVVSPFRHERMASLLESYRPHAVGVTAVTMTFDNAMRVVRAVKKIDPDILTLMGGPHVTFCAPETLRAHREVDIIVCGEGEHTLVDIDAWQSHIFSKAARVEIRPAQGIADGVVSTKTIMARVAGNMMSGTDPITHFIMFHLLPTSNHHAGNFMTQD